MARLFLTAFVVFMLLVHVGAAEQATLFQFSGGADGGNAAGPLTVDRAGNLYGATDAGGQGFGVIFRLAPPSAKGGAWTESVLYTFTGGADGGYPNGGLALDGSGHLYGTVAAGVFRLSPPVAGGAWTYSMLYTFPVGDWQPSGSLVLDARGDLYGTNQNGGAAGLGQVYELSPPAPGGDSWTFAALYDFQQIPDGQYPDSGVIFDSEGNLYGVTNQGGTGKCRGEGSLLGCGAVFELRPSRGGWNESVIYSFKVRQNNMPFWGLTLGKNHALYGTATYAAFRLVPPPRPGEEWLEQTLYQFTEGISGTIPDGGVILDARGNLYGTTASSGISGYSTVFELSPPAEAAGPWTETTLATFGTGFNTDYPNGGLIRGKFDALYGVTDGNGTDFGSVFAIMP